MKDSIEQLLAAALADWPDANALPAESRQPDLERTRDVRHGDFASNLALRLAKPLGRKPRDIAESIVARLPASPLVDKVELAGPGFINFHLTPAAYHAELRGILAAGEEYGRNDSGANRRVLVEFVSANPTGPLHVGHGRHAAYGATVANLLTANGYAVDREYYVNDAGRQMDILAVSLWLRLYELRGHSLPFPTGAYRGSYLVDVARECLTTDIESLLPDPGGLFDDLPPDDNKRADEFLDAFIARARERLGEQGFDRLVATATEAILGDIRNDLEEFGVAYDAWFSERSLVESGAVHRAIERVAKAGHTYKQDGAVWFRATDFDDEKDRVIIRENGRKTYFASDIAYHLHKRERDYEQLVDILGADHHGYVARVKAGLAAMGEPPDCLEVDLVQFVVLYRGTEKVQMSTRSGDFVTLRTLREEVGNDAARFFFVSRSNVQHLDFDLELAKSHSNDNPVYYIQYAHARVCSVLAKLEPEGYTWDRAEGEANLARLTEAHESSLQRTLARYPEIIALAGRQRAPQHLVHYLRDLANDLHAYYSAHPFIVEDSQLRNARLALIIATRQVLRNGLALIGVSAPERM